MVSYLTKYTRSYFKYSQGVCELSCKILKTPPPARISYIVVLFHMRYQQVC